MQSAEKRNALTKALGYLEKAERLDGLNPDVKRARLRLLTATAIRHLKQQKTHLAQKDFAAIEALPQSNEGDRPAFLVALKTVGAIIDREDSHLDRLTDELIKLFDNQLTAQVVMEGLLKVCGLPYSATKLSSYTRDPLTGDDLVAAVARGCKLGDDMGVPIAIPSECEEKMDVFFTTKDCTLDTSTISTIAEAALCNKNLKLAYTASGAGLLRGGAALARFLLLRARSLPTWEMSRQDDCITAAIELARRERAMDLIDEAIELRRNRQGSRYGFSIWNVLRGERNLSMDTEDLNDVLNREREAREYPSSMSPGLLDGFDDDLDDDEEYTPCKHCEAKDCPDRTVEYVSPRFDDDDYDDDDYFDDDVFDPLPDIPEGIMSRLMEMILKQGNKKGHLPDPQELAQKNPKLAEQILQILLDAETEGDLPNFGNDWFSGSSRRSRKSRRNR
jgi:hypothetical protein